MHFLLYLILSQIFSSSYLYGVLFLADILALVTIPSILLARAGRPHAALSWILGVMAFPFVGVFLWWTFGRIYLKRALRKRLERSLSASKPREETPLSIGLARILPVSSDENEAGSSRVYPMSFASSFTILAHGEEFFRSLLEEISAAQHAIMLMFYIWEDDKTGEMVEGSLSKAKSRGVAVYILLDGTGSGPVLRKKRASWEDRGFRVGIFHPTEFKLALPTFNFRNHRKLCIIDEKVAFTGGMNIGDEYRLESVDLMVRVEGEVVKQMRDVFFDDWIFATKEILEGIAESDEKPSGGTKDVVLISSGPDAKESWIHDILFLVISSAQKTLRLTTPYFIPSQPILTALRAASLRGVDVRVLLPHHTDVFLVRFASRTYLRLLLEAGVRVFLYRGTFLHRKSLVVDQNLVLLGSANVDARSFRLNFELSLLSADEEIGGQLNELFAQNEQEAYEIHLGDLKKATRLRRLIESLIHLLSPLL